MLTAALLHVVVLAQMQGAVQQHAPRVPLPRPAPTAVRATANDNRVAAGTRVGNRLTVGLEIVESAWRPEGETDPEVPVLAFAEVGKAPSVPGPLIRVPLGTTMRLTLRNRTDSALVIRGLRPGGGAGRRSASDTVRLAAGGTREVDVHFTAPGTFYYSGAFEGHDARVFKDGQLNGAIVVDPPGARTDDHILLMSEWFYPRANSRDAEAVTVINGKGWPHTPRLEFMQGDTVRFRVINTIGFNHPMHLHGFYYRLESQGDGRTDTPIPASRQVLSNTDLIPALGTYTLRFVASRPGNWLYHCHFAFHIDESASLAGATFQGESSAPAAHDHDAMASSDEHMRGLVLGFTVKPRPDYVEPSMLGARTLHLFAQEKAGLLYAGGTLQSYVLQQGPKPPAPDSVVLPSSVIELERGKPVRIMVHNNLREPTAVHWHGLEIESFPDGVPNFSGYGARIFTSVAPRDSFAAEFTPPRAGTYPYHTHFNDRGQMLAGLYGALLVTDGPRDLAHDHLVVIGGAGPWVERFYESPYGVVNGSPVPEPLTLTAGEAHRLRVVMLHPDWTVTVRLRSETPTGSSTGRWTPIAKDGADLPAALRIPMLAQTRMGPGQTADFTFTPSAPGEWVLDVLADDGGWHVAQRVIVERAKPRANAPVPRR